MQIEDYLYEKDLQKPLLGEKPDTMITEVDLVDAVQKHDVQPHQREDDIRPIEGVVKYVRKSVGYEQGVCKDRADTMTQKGG